MATLRDRLIFACLSVGIKNAPDLNRKWRETHDKDLPRQTSNLWFHGAKEPQDISPKYLFWLEDVTGFSARWIATGDGAPGAGEQLDPDEKLLIQEFDKLDQERQEKAIAMVIDMRKAKQSEQV